MTTDTATTGTPSARTLADDGGGTVRPRYSPVQCGGFTEAQVAGIEARVRYGALPWYRRWREPRPPTWAQTTKAANR